VSLDFREEKGPAVDQIVSKDAVPFHGGPVVRIRLPPAASLVRTGLRGLFAQLRVTKEALTIEGTLKTFTSIGGSGNPILRHFCPECGSSIAEEPGTRPGMIILNVGTFDDPTVAKAGREIFRDDALPWVEVHGEIPRFAKRPD
jgi:hypothetical protein